MPSTRPRISYDDEGRCNGCQTWALRERTDWDARGQEFHDVVGNAVAEANRRQTPYDCVLAWSGGKDSTAIALRLKNEFGLRVLLVTFNQLLPTAEGRRNRCALIEHGFDSILVEPNAEVSRALSRFFFESRGDPKLHWNAGVHAYPVRIARDMGIPVVFFAENGEAEYGGRLLSPDHLRSRDYSEMVSNAVGGDPLDWSVPGVNSEALTPYLYPSTPSFSGPFPEVLYFAYFFPWDGKVNLEYVNQHLEFTENRTGRNYGAFSGHNGVDDVMEDLYYYMQYIKFGFGRAWKDASRMIQRGHLTPEEARDLVKPVDGEVPTDSLAPAADYMQVSGTSLTSTIERFRARSLWSKNSGGLWECRFNIDDAIEYARLFPSDFACGGK